jgi:hypothetical protein
MAARTGGRVLSLDDPSPAFAPTETTGAALQEYRPLWQIPLTAALVLFLIEIALRMGVTWASLSRTLPWRSGPA